MTSPDPTPPTVDRPHMCGVIMGRDGECGVARSGIHQCALMGPHERHRCGCGRWAPSEPAVDRRQHEPELAGTNAAWYAVARDLQVENKQLRAERDEQADHIRRLEARVHELTLQLHRSQMEASGGKH